LHVLRKGGLKSGPYYLAANTEIRIADGKHAQQLYHLGETFVAQGYRFTPTAISRDGDSLRVVREPLLPGGLPIGNFPGLAFQPATLPDVHGQNLVLTGRERPLVLDFWGTWCTPCVALTPRLIALQQRYANSIDLVSIAMDEPDKVRTYLQAHQITWANAVVAYHQPASLVERLAVTDFPTFLLVYQGQIIYRGSGAQGLDAMEKKLATLVPH
jgi:thiol-disulfide isomerase/thioredoxin